VTVGPVGDEEVGSSLPDIQYQGKVTLSPVIFPREIPAAKGDTA
jgi:hypothetical protein